MAIKLIANYSKRLGLPGYSSHQFSVSVEAELSASDNIAAESTRLYQLLQSNVDEQMLHTGFVPPTTYGLEPPPDRATSDTTEPTPSNVTHVDGWRQGTAWRCSDKQKDLILKLVEEHKLDKSEVEALAVDRFGKGVRVLNKVEASGLIDELLEAHGGSKRRDNRRNGQAYRSQGRDAA